jgi:hypothetical protein
MHPTHRERQPGERLPYYRRWANPPLDVLFADGLTAEEAGALHGVDGGGLLPESADLFLSAISDEFYDVYSDAYYDTGTPCASLAPYGVFRLILDHVTVTVTVTVLSCSNDSFGAGIALTFRASVIV